MEEMRQAGDVGDISKAVEKTDASASEYMERHASATNDSGTRRNSEISEDNRGQSVDYWKDMHSHQNSRDFKDDNPHRRHDSRRQYSNKSIEGIQHDRDDIYEIRDKRRTNNHLRVRMHDREKSDFVEAFAEDDSQRSQQRRSESQDRKYHKSTSDEHERTTDKRRRDEHDRSNNRKRGRGEDYWEHEDRERSKRDRVSKERDEDKRGRDDRRKGKSNRSSSSRRELHEFDDRYDPTVSHDLYEDDH